MQNMQPPFCFYVSVIVFKIVFTQSQ